jgi:predicted RNase H-related nuclease YkuK (DUF458 family)
MFKKFNGEKIPSISKYVKKYVATHKNIDVIVATDSQTRGYSTVFATIIAMYDRGTDGHGHGAHCIVNRWKVTPKYPKEMKDTRLLDEVKESIKVAKELKNGGVHVTYVDIDINPKKNAGSNSVFSSAVSMVNWDGFECRWKNLAPLATTLADHVVKH